MTRKAYGVPRPVSIAAAPCVGLCVVLFSPLISDPRPSLAAAIVLAASSLALVASPFGRSRRAPWLLGAALGLAAGAALSVARLGAEARSGLGIPISRVTGLTGILSADSRNTAEGKTLYRVGLTRTRGSRGEDVSAAGAALVVAGRGESLAKGTRLSVACSVAYAEWPLRYIAFAESGTSADEPSASAFDAARASIRAAVLDATEYAAEGPKAASLRGALYGAAASIGFGAAGRADPGSSPSQGLFRAMLLGITDSLAEEETETFRKAGCIHVLSLSGEHLGILAALLAVVFRPLLGKRKSVVAGVLVILSYVLLVGLQPALVRSCAMYFYIACAFLLRRPVRGIQALSIAFLFMALTNQEAAVSLSSRLSFLSLLGIMTIGSKLYRPFSAWTPKPVAAGVAASIGAMVATAWLSAASFGCVFPIGVIASVVTAPVVAAFMWTGFAYLAVVPLGAPLWLGAAASAALDGIYKALMSLMNFFARAPYLELGGAGGTAAALGSLALVLALLYLWPNYRYSRTDRRLLSAEPRNERRTATPD